MKRGLVYVAMTLGLAGLGASADADGHLADIGDHRLYVHCTGGPSKMTVILENGLGAGLEVWKAVQSGVEPFAKVCSYDRAGEGRSDKPATPQTPDSIVDDLHRLLELEKIQGPYVLVGASLGGIYVRQFAVRYPDSIAGMVLVDSSHEEQYSRYWEISPAIAERYATQDGRFQRDDSLRAAGQLEPGKRLAWHMDIPLTVLEHKRLAGPPRTEEDRLAVAWHEMQVDLAGRSKYGKLIETASGHFIAGEQPEVVVDAIRDVMGEAGQAR